MLNINICAKCPHGEYHPSFFDDEGRMTRAPWADCALAVGELSYGDEVPDGCPYVLEHALTQEQAWDSREALNEEFYKELNR